MAPLSEKIKTGLFSAVNDLNPKISVLKEPIPFLDAHTLSKCAQNGAKQLKIVDSLAGNTEEIDVSEGIVLHGYNFLLIVELNARICREGHLLATAKPCENSFGHRPMIGLLNICDGSRWDNFHSARDLFRHEILHSLGFGTINPEDRGHVPFSEGYDWFEGGKSQKAIRHFMDFSKEAVVVARDHFHCPEMRGVEADNENRIHLNEYIFGNELMTPRVTNGLNPFSLISASILENTHTGTVRWYQINRTALQEENSQYWYGRGWGCTFVQESCHKLQGWPFCSKESLRKGFVTYCVKDRQGLIRRSNSPCITSPFKSAKAADNGVQASPLTYSPFKGVTGEPSLFRFCPIAADVFHNKISLSPGSQVFSC